MAVVREYWCNNGNSYSSSWILVGVVLVLWVSTLFQEVEAVRVIHERKMEDQNQKWWLQKNHLVILQILPRGNVKPPSGNPCSNIPGGRGRCTLAAASDSHSSASVTATSTTTPFHHHPPPPPPPPSPSPAAAFTFQDSTRVHLNQESSS